MVVMMAVTVAVVMVMVAGGGGDGDNGGSMWTVHPCSKWGGTAQPGPSRVAN